MFGRIIQWSHPVLDFCLHGVFCLFVSLSFCFCFITDSISLLVIGLFNLFVSYLLSFGRLYVFRNISISSKLSNLLTYNCSQYFLFFFFLFYCLFILVFLCYQLLFLLFHLLFCLFGSFLFPSWWAWLEVCWFWLSFQGTNSWFYWAFLLLLFLFLIFHLFLSPLIFIIPFLLLTFSFVCSSFSNSFRWWVRFFIWDFSCFQGRPVSLWTFLLELLLLHPIYFVRLCFHFVCLKVFSDFFLWFHHWALGFLVACCLVSMCLLFSHFSFYGWFLVSYCYGQKRCLK